MAEQSTKGTRRASNSKRRTAAAGDALTGTASTARGATNAAAESAPTDALEDVRGDQQEAVGGLVDSTTDELAEHTSRRDQPTVRDELAAIVRESAIEILGPVARNATRQAAKYAVKRGPQLVTQTIAPRVKDTLGTAIEDAGGPGELARGALSSASERRAGLLSKVGIGRGRGDGSQLGSESLRVPIEQSIDVAVPLETAYDQFTQFEELAKFMSQGERVDERPNERIVWRNTDESGAMGVITFHSLSDRLTRVMVTYDAQPHGIAQRTASVLRTSSRALRSDLARFKAFAEMTEDEADRDEGDVAVEEPRRRGAGGRRRPSAPAAEDEEDEYDTDEEAVADDEEEPTARRSQTRTRQPVRSRPARQAGRRR